MLSLKDLKKLDRDDLLDLVGLQRSSSNDWIAPALTALGVGLLVGAGLGLLLAPKAGSELRNDLKDRLRTAQEALPEQLREATANAPSPPLHLTDRPGGGGQRRPLVRGWPGEGRGHFGTVAPG
jgi:hypothetical protein